MVSSSNNDSIPWQPWKRENKSYNAEKLVIPLPVPHPAHIAITIHNRDSDDPINLHSEMCNNILKALEDSQVNRKFSLEKKKEKNWANLNQIL